MKSVTELKQQLAELKAQQPKLRNRDLAKTLGISEVELLTLEPGDLVTRLAGDWKDLLLQIKRLGYVMALTRNEHCIHERKGVYDNISFYDGSNNVGVAVNPDIDLRFFMNEWKYGLAVIMPRGKMDTLFSFQFFNGRGEAVHKIFSTGKTDVDAYHRLVEAFKAADQGFITDVDHSPVYRKAETPDEKIDVAGFQQAWSDLQDTHHFFGMLKKYGVTRTQALRLAPEGLAEKVDNEAVVRALEMAASLDVPIMCFVHSSGCVQIHTGTVKNLKYYGSWYNVLDPQFNLHLNTEAIHTSWVVRKPTADGIVTSLELFDAEGNLIVYFFGARKPGKAELQQWRELVNDLPNTATV
ncbi:MAG: ChuX/HutX family heme-like substrate-binding protein [Saprospiraceae bacterium]|nr:hemin-degrading factor [Lewinella sp.]